MARYPSLPPGIAQHVIQRGSSRKVCFDSDEELAACVHWLEEMPGTLRWRLKLGIYEPNQGAKSRVVQSI